MRLCLTTQSTGNDVCCFLSTQSTGTVYALGYRWVRQQPDQMLDLIGMIRAIHPPALSVMVRWVRGLISIGSVGL
jgi:hypothetical protein